MTEVPSGTVDGQAVDLELHCRRAVPGRRSEVVLLEQRHDCSPRVIDDYSSILPQVG